MRNFTLNLPAALVALICALWSSPLVASPPLHAQWELTFRDEFEGDAVDWEVWESQATIRGGDRLEGRWPQNNLVKDGILHQVTRREDPPREAKQWSTAHIWTRAFRQTYGYFEASMRYGRYLNNAFWLYRTATPANDPPHFEIDVNEGHTPREVAMAFHHYVYPEGATKGALLSTGKRWEAPVGLDKDFHVYGVEWNENLIIWHFDGKPVRVLENPGTNAPVDVRLSTVIMPRQLAADSTDISTMDGVSMDVDWVRVYKKTRDLYMPDLPPAREQALPQVVPTKPRLAPPKPGRLILTEDFEPADTEALPPNWQIGDGQPLVASRQDEGAALKLDAEAYAYHMFDAPAQGQLIVDMDCRMDWPDMGLLFVTLGKFDDTDSESRKSSYHTGDIGPYIHWYRLGYLSYYTEQSKWTYIARWQHSDWQHIRIVLDVTEGVFDCYRGPDAQEFVGSGVFRHRQKAALGIGLRNRGKGPPVYVDNIVVREPQNASH